MSLTAHKSQTFSSTVIGVMIYSSNVRFLADLYSMMILKDKGYEQDVGQRQVNSSFKHIKAEKSFSAVKNSEYDAQQGERTLRKHSRTVAKNQRRSWLKLFERYADCRNQGYDDKKRLFIILLRGGASDWLSTFQEVEEKSYDQLIEVFKKAFLPSPELKWTEASASLTTWMARSRCQHEYRH
jgi:hypothetical protein